MSDELEELRKRKLAQMQEGIARQQEAQEQENAMEVQKEVLLKQVLTPEAKSRLTNIKLANPEFATQIEYLLLRLYQTGQVKKIDDQQLKAILLKITKNKRDITITRK
ncbi:DNA-binding protein [archaeon]|nr:DNA-binding protein [archaeon]